MSLLDKRLERTPLNAVLTLDDLSGFRPFSELKDYSVLMYSLTRSAVGWPKERWKELARLIAARDPGEILVLLGPAEEDLRQEFEAALQDLPRAHVRCVADFAEVIGILAGAKSYIGTSTGITHLASALGVPGVALYPEAQSMHPQRWCPFRSTLRIVSLSAAPTAAEVHAALHGDLKSHLDPLRREEVSAFVVCCNEEANIRRCLRSLAWCDELIVVDSGSKDATVSIAREFTDKIHQRPWPGHKEQKQFALEQCTRKWVLNIDSDEELSFELRGEILDVLMKAARGKRVANGYLLCRLVHFLNRWWDKGGWYPEYRMRFFKREHARWGGVNPHEKALVDGPVRRLGGDLHHFTYAGFPDQLESLNKHSSYAAQHLFREGKRCRPWNLVSNPLMRLFKFYVMKRGFREGRAGFVVAFMEAGYTFMKYAKLWELQRRAAMQPPLADIAAARQRQAQAEPPRAASNEG